MKEGLPAGWARAPLADVCANCDSKRVPLNAAARAVRKGDYPYYGANGRVDSVDDYLYDGDFVLLAEDGGFFDDPLRQVAYQASGKFWVNNHAHVLSPLGGILTNFLLHALNQVDWMPYVSGTTRLKLTQGGMQQVLINLPPLNEQRRIVAKIEALTARSARAKEALDAIPGLLERYRQSVLAAAFRGDLTADWREAHPDVEPASELLERIRTQRRSLHTGAKGGRGYQEPSFPGTGRTPTLDVYGDINILGWSGAPLDLLCDPQRGVPYGIILTGADTPGGVPTVRCGDIKRFTIDIAGLKRVDPDIANAYDRTKLQGGEVLIAIRGTVGATTVVPPEMKGMNVSREVAVIPLIEGVLPRYVMFLLACPVGQAVLMGHVKGVAQTGINLNDLRSFPVPLPPQAEQWEIVRLIDEAFEKIGFAAGVAGNATRSLSTLNQSILAKAFRGELVPQDPNDEPASALLARIEAERAAAGGADRKRRRRAS